LRPNGRTAFRNGKEPCRAAILMLGKHNESSARQGGTRLFPSVREADDLLSPGVQGKPGQCSETLIPKSLVLFIYFFFYSYVHTMFGSFLPPSSQPLPLPPKHWF
jgi:hypothetical protein